jgi:hypothetical protein
MNIDLRCENACVTEKNAVKKIAKRLKNQPTRRFKVQHKIDYA